MSDAPILSRLLILTLLLLTPLAGSAHNISSGSAPFLEGIDGPAIAAL